MHRIFGGLFVVVFLIVASLASSAAAQQITGKVESIGFDGNYRPGTWTPMRVQLALAGATPGNFELRVWQHDLDGDLPYYARPISLSGGETPQTFWTYFIPEPIHGGLPNTGTADLAGRIRITVHDANTGREIMQVPLGTASAVSIDPSFGAYESARASRFVLFVGTASAPPLRDYDPGNLLGVKEDLHHVRIRPDQMPENAIAFEGIDAIVWLEGDPSELERGGGQRLTAIRDYVRRGGHLVLCTPVQWQQLIGFGDLMPVDITGTEQNAQQSPVADLAARVPFPSGAQNATGAPVNNPWRNFRQPFTIATAAPRPGAVVDLYSDRVADPQTDADRTPWLVRRPFGVGCVTWVAQDLGSRELSTQANWGWPAVWETVLGAESFPVVHPSQSYTNRWKTERRRDLGFTILKGMNLTGRAAQLIGLTVLFFIGYWLIAGPGAYFWLRFKSRATLNWFAFGLIAVAATGITLLLVRLVLRGSPDVRHVSLVRINMADVTDPAIARSRLGMYVPRDGAQTIALRDADLSYGPSITPFPIHPTIHGSRDGDRFLYAAPREYRVVIPGGDAGESAEAAAEAGRSSAVIDVPFRTTMKRLQANFYGTRPERITGDATLRMPNEGYIAGTLHNETGRDLRNAYIAFRHQTPGNAPVDWMLFVARWDNGTRIDLGRAFNPQDNRTVANITVGNGEDDAEPNGDFPVRGRMSDWRDFLSGSRWLRAETTSLDAMAVEDFDEGLPVSVPILSFFNRIPPIENNTAGGTMTRNRADLYRSGLREWDASNALLSGRLVIVAQADGVPLPVPLDVESEAVEGSGTTIYQFVLPLTQIPPPPPTTTPATTNPAQ